MARTVAQLSCLALFASTALATVKLDFARERRTTHLSRRANGDLDIALNQDADQNSYIIKLSVGTPPQVSTIPVSNSEKFRLLTSPLLSLSNWFSIQVAAISGFQLKMTQRARLTRKTAAMPAPSEPTIHLPPARLR